MPAPDREDQDGRALRAIRSLEPGGAGGGIDPHAAEEAQLGRLGGIVRSLSDEDIARDEPPPGVWDAIEARIGRSPPQGASAAVAASAGAPGPAPVPLHRKPRRTSVRARVLAVGAAAAAVLLVVGVLVARGGDGEPVVVASARLEPLPDQPAGDARAVDARVVQSDGGLQLDLALGDSGLPEPEGYYEVWLIDPDVEGMVSLGPARSDGAYAVPPDIDIAAFPIVDVSVEPPDGIPTHSGVSVLRGTLA
jgi:anti-sigma-K factor RskA